MSDQKKELCDECGEMSDEWTFIPHFGIVCYKCQEVEHEPDNDPGPIIDRDCDYWNKVT